MRTIQVRIEASQTDQTTLVHRFRNYGEDVFRHTRDAGKGMGQVDLGEIDSATDQFLVRCVARKNVRGLCRWLEDEGARQNLCVETEVREAADL